VHRHQREIASYSGPCDFVICIDAGFHQLGGKTLSLDQGYNRRDGGRVVWTSTRSDKPAVLSGGLQVTKWIRCDDGLHCPGTDWHGVWVAQVEDIQASIPASELPVRHLWVDGVPAGRAYAAGHTLGLRGHDRGYISNLPTSYFGSWVDSQVEVRWPRQTKQWTEPRCLISGVQGWGGGSLLIVEPTCWAAVTKWNWGERHPPPPAFVENVPNEPPRPGQFIAMRKYIFYRPPESKAYERPANAFIPHQERLVQAEGLVNHEFKHIQFRHGTWRIPNRPGGYVDGQTLVTWKEGEPFGAVAVKSSQRVVFDRCSFINIGSPYGLSVGDRSKNVRVTGCHFHRCSGGAVKLGNVDDQRAIRTEAAEFDEDLVLEQSTLEEVATEFRDAAAIFAGYVRKTTIAQNTIMNTGYTAISLGWGWGQHVSGPQTWARENHILRNKVIGMMQGLNDGGCIYTLGPQPDSSVEGNYCKFNPAEQTGFFYFDNGSRYFRARNNVADSGTAPCVNLQGCCNQPALDIDVSHTHCRNTAAVRNGCYAQGCRIDMGSLYTVHPSADFSPAAEDIIRAAGATSTVTVDI